jgi:acyl dehydratase
MGGWNRLMPVLVTAEGTAFETRTLTVTPRMTLAFAACLDCSDERYLDDAREGGLEAPPPFCVSLEWLLTGDPGVKARLGLTAEERLRAVHVGQSTQFHRPLMAGETISVAGRVKSIRNTRAGALVASELTVFGAGETDPITISRSEAIYRGVACDAPMAEGLPAELCVGEKETSTKTSINISRGFPHIYSECASIWNPIHTERRVALRAGLPDIIVHGTALWAFAWKHFSQTGGAVSHLAGRFSAMAIPGHPVTLRSPLSTGVSADTTFCIDNHLGSPAVSAGSVSFREN